MLRQLESRLRGYRRWLPADHRLLVIVDLDSDDCSTLNQRIEDIGDRAGLKCRSRHPDEWQLATCIAIEELEAWYFGDWQAVQSAYPSVSPNTPTQARYRHADQIAGGTWEAFEQVMQKSGYFPGGLQKIKAAQEIGAHISAARSASPSFQHLARVIAEVP